MNIKKNIIWFLNVLMLLQACETQTNTSTVTESPKYTNALIKETSPYLLQHAHNPVEWHPWNQKTLQMAKEQDKMLLISIGYSSCHWCHVMEHESFEDSAVAEIMNAHFICIKVDREERPDVDEVYMSAVQQITGRGGWPLNCFALPDGRPFHGGTYFPKENWKRVLLTVAHEFENNREKLEEFAEKLKHNMEQEILPMHQERFSNQEDQNILDSTLAKWSSNMDSVFGGANRAPKFPLPNNYEFLMDYGLMTNNVALLNHVEVTLKAMARGGIYDQLGGGFARYSVDGFWKVPHFEKMLYDNAQLLELYAKAYRWTQNPEYLDVIQETCNWLFQDMEDESGAFYSALDADSEGEEGRFYVWEKGELEKVLGEDVNWFTKYYPVEEKGEWEGKYILIRDSDKVDFAKRMNWTVSEFQEKLGLAKKKLLEVRKERIRPGLDDKCLTSWNGLLLSGFCEVYKATQDGMYLDKARRIGAWIKNVQMNEDGELMHTFKKGESSISGFLEDYAFSISGLIQLGQVTGEDSWMVLAEHLSEEALELFYMDDEVLMANTSKSQEDILMRKVSYYDNVIPSANSEMCANLRVLGLYFDRPEWEEKSSEMLNRVKPFVKSYGSGFSNWLNVLQLDVLGSKELVVVGKKAPKIAKEYWETYRPNVDVFFTESQKDNGLFKNRFYEGETKIYLCIDKACQLPVNALNDVSW